MIIRNTLKAAALASVCLVPLAAAAQDDTGFAMPETPPNTQALTTISNKPAEVYDNEATIGLRGQSSTSAAYGRYNGWYNDGIDVVGSLKLHSHQDWKSADTSYLYFDAKDLAFGGGSFNIAPNSEVDLRTGDQGSWGLSADYWADTYVASNNFSALYNTNGTRTGGISLYGSGGGVNPANIAKMQDFLVGTRRDRGSVSAKYIYGDLLFTGGLTHEHKEGTQEGFIDFPTNATFLEPIDYDTDRVDAAAAYNTHNLQASLGYTFSKFTDNNTAIDFQNVNTTTTGAVYVLPPSNMAHQFTGQVGYNLGETTRLNFNGVYGLQLQNDNFQPATLNTAVAVASPPRNSLDGLVQTVFGNVALSTQPMPKTDLRISYTVDLRENNTPAEYGVEGLRLDNGSGVTRLTPRTPLNESWTKQTATITAGYRILPSTRVTLGYTYRDTDRSDALIKTNTENEASAQVHTTFGNSTTGSLGYTHSVRTASVPNYQIWSQIQAGGADCGQTNGGYTPDCVQIPYYMAGRTEDAVKERLTQSIGSDASASFGVGFANDHYPSVNYGRTRDYKITAGPDLNYRFSPDTEAHAFYTFERSYNTFDDNSVANPGAHPQDNWSETTTADTHTFGMGGTTKPFGDVKVGADYYFSYGFSDFAESGVIAGVVGAPIDQLPNVTSMLNSFKLHGEYEYAPGVTLYLGYGFDRLISNDWAMYGATAAYSSGEGNPSYAVHSVISRVSFKW